MLLSDEIFRSVISATPLISIDLVVCNDNGEVLLGKRLNRPAQGAWFVPGGRIRKNESLENAFKRLTLEELGCEFYRSHAFFLGVFEHFYADSYFGKDHGCPDTHYVVLAYLLKWPCSNQGAWPLSQHSRFKWWSVETAISNSDVHSNTKAYLPYLARN